MSGGDQTRPMGQRMALAGAVARGSRPLALLIALAVLAAACGDGETGSSPTTLTSTTTLVTSTAPPSTTTVTTTSTATTTTAAPTTTTDPPSSTTTTTPSVPDPPVVPAVEALAWGLFCRDLRAAGHDYLAAVAYWYGEGRPARMDADENGIPCETVYPTSDVVAFWGDPLPIGLSPGPGSGWSRSAREAPTELGCCSMNDNGPVSPPLPPPTGGWPHDGAYAISVDRDQGETDAVEVTIRRWLPCSENPDRCSPDLYPGDVYPDRDTAVVRRLDLDEELLVVLRPIWVYRDGEFIDSSIEADGTALATLLGRLDAAVETFAAPLYAGGDPWGELLERGAEDATFPYGPASVDYENLLSYRGPEGTFLTDGLWAIFEWDEPAMFGWWCTLEVIDGQPVLYIWAGQIAG